jgi:hypothetical protein
MNRTFRLFPATLNAARTFATASHQPPKKVHGTSGKYASAVYTAASKVSRANMMTLVYISHRSGRSVAFKGYLVLFLFHRSTFLKTSAG